MVTRDTGRETLACCPPAESRSISSFSEMSCMAASSLALVSESSFEARRREVSTWACRTSACLIYSFSFR
jgi:hypothetical protein